MIMTVIIGGEMHRFAKRRSPQSADPLLGALFYDENRKIVERGSSVDSAFIHSDGISVQSIGELVNFTKFSRPKNRPSGPNRKAMTALMRSETAISRKSEEEWGGLKFWAAVRKRLRYSLRKDPLAENTFVVH